ncbi:universal stress protein [Tetragenococcus koreensis]|uniref:Universal stress protein n=1 Tax=Tetragenococcus koreensis TaxID=290335 RepID=A0AAN4RKH3_9ENTE|nr:universal stress protein [Tetragenococcus koreensis]MDN6403306.1 universal stress protein [Lactococcus lactis]MDN6507962.1 universal stress protein [Tetragenococcus halophilus]AYW46124.1 universal stress protein [Tetragenococcus koreensis]MCF1618332.1 universal stress protein [Tetragenococcus koreensis]MCF1623120.1 universal stress protein [Tetragenococcus koreensis]
MDQTYQTVLVGVDGSSQANEAFEKAVEVARRNNGRVLVVKVIEQQVPSTMGFAPLGESVLAQEEKDANELIQECKDYAASVSFENIEGLVVYGSTKTALTAELPEKYGVDLIMVGQSGLNAVERFITGSVASYVIRQAPCDVLIITPSKESES